jgi:hypothetical protein
MALPEAWWFFFFGFITSVLSYTSELHLRKRMRSCMEEKLFQGPLLSNYKQKRLSRTNQEQNECKPGDIFKKAFSFSLEWICLRSYLKGK